MPERTTDWRARAERTAADPLVACIGRVMGLTPSALRDLIMVVGRAWVDAAEDDRDA